jgi:23S rRNA (guanosine2251-2'-O)-methyltransferase
VERRQEIGRHNSRESDFIYGIRAVLEALSAGQEIEKVLIQKDLRNDLIRQLISQLKGTRYSLPSSAAGKTSSAHQKKPSGSHLFHIADSISVA